MGSPIPNSFEDISQMKHLYQADLDSVKNSIDPKIIANSQTFDDVVCYRFLKGWKFNKVSYDFKSL